MLKEKGYFILSDGTKSTDHEPTGTRKRKTAGTLADSPGKKRKSAHIAAKPSVTAVPTK
jgi:hypothetical protein